MTNQERLYGQLLVDFANATTIDEAAIGFLENVQRVFRFSHGFVEKAKEGFPFPDDPEKYSTAATKARDVKALYDDIVEYNALTITVLNEVMKGNSPENSDLIRSFLMPYEIRKSGKTMISILENLSNHRSFEQQDFLDIYNRLTVDICVSEDGKESKSTNVGLEFSAVLSLCLREFIRNPKNTEYLRKCTSCEDFFIAKHLRREVCYPPKDCEKLRKRKTQRDLMRRKRDPESDDFDPKYVR
ncbi:MAG: hypothetical protein JSU72_01005 [Deltaproteobacteria bacterium]|nr:MAG: hypothetical protein JSU72_01005 [Deltaproteobacteria bacterium]